MKGNCSDVGKVRNRRIYHQPRGVSDLYEKYVRLILKIDDETAVGSLTHTHKERPMAKSVYARQM